MRSGEAKKFRHFLRADDRGASLIAVIVTMVFVLTMAAIITEITTTNIRMRQIEVSEKENFYEAEIVMDDLRREMAKVAAEKMELAYAEALSRYGELLSRYADESSAYNAALAAGSGEAGAAGEVQVPPNLRRVLQAGFNQIYVDELAAYFRLDSTYQGEESVFITGKYKEDVIKDLLDDDAQELFRVAEADRIFTIDYEKGIFTLKNLRIEFKEAGSSYETWLTTDMVFAAPEFEFDNGIAEAFMEYALIADNSIQTGQLGRSETTVAGSVYAGAGGIIAEPASGSGNVEAHFVGNNIVTRGDIVAKDNSQLTFGDAAVSSFAGISLNNYTGTTHVWAQNLRVEGTSTEALVNLRMVGEINIEDDLALNGVNSRAELKGSYNGYSFRENYSQADSVIFNVSPARESLYSSAIMINGTNCSLNLKELDNLYLAGRTFIARGSRLLVSSTNNDIMLGESLSVRANQLAYLVNERYLKKDSENNVVLKTDPGTGMQVAEFSDDGILLYGDVTGVDLTRYTGKITVVPYKYRNQLVLSGTVLDPITQYYLNFDTEDTANRFFNDYWTATGGKLAEYGSSAEAIQLNKDTILTLSGDILYRNNGEEDDGFRLHRFDVNGSSWEEPDKIYWERSDKLARTYKSLQDDLAGIYTKVASKDVRFSSDGIYVDPVKTNDPLFDNLIDRDALAAMAGISGSNIAQAGNTTTITGSDSGGEWQVVLCRNEGDSAYEVTSSFRGIVIATGNVNITTNGIKITGLVISGGTIQLGGTGVQVEGDADFVKRIFKEIEDREYGEQFTAIFKEYHSDDTEGVSGARLGDYLYYENWMKNEGTVSGNGA